jgi:adenylate cyclase
MQRWVRWVVSVGLACVAGLAAVTLGRSPLGRGVEWQLYDLRMRRTADPARAPSNLVFVDIDEDSIRDLEPLVGRWPWPRLIHGRLVDYLARAPARVIVYDILFGERDAQDEIDIAGSKWTGAESDKELADAAARAGNVIFAADATAAGSNDPAAAGASAGPQTNGVHLDDSFEARPEVVMPIDAIARASAGIGHNLFPLDDDGPIRRVAPFVRADGRFVPSLAFAAYIAAQKIPASRVALQDDLLIVGDRRVPLMTFEIPRFAGEAGQKAGRYALVRFRGPAVLPDGKTTTYPHYSFADLLLSDDQLREGQTPRVDPAVFRDKIVFVGASAAGLHDVHATPLGNTGDMPGTLIQAAITDQLVSSRFLAPVPFLPQMLLLFGGVLLVSALTVAFPMRVGAGATAVAFAGVTGLAFMLFARGWWLSLFEPLAGIAIASTGGLAWQYFVAGRERRQVKQLFSRYLSKDVYDQVLANPALAELGGRRRTMSVLFSDVRGFTALSEKGEPEALVKQLNEYFSRMVDLVFAHRGTLDKFVGDMVMALFGAPLDDEEHADHAVQTALAMVRALGELNVKWEAEGRPALGIGIGVNSGEMIAGNIGAETVRSYTVIGDSVNLGARLESLNKDYRTQIIISEFTARRLKARYNLRPLGQVVVKGKSVPVEIFEVLTQEPEPS